MASTDRSTAIRAYNVLSRLLIYYAHREEHLAMMVCGRTSLTVRCGCPISLKEGCKSVMKWNSGDVKNCECSQHNCLISPGLTCHCKNCFSCFPPYRVPLVTMALHYLANPPSFSHRFAAPLLICLKRHINYSAKFILPVFMGEFTVTKWPDSGRLHANIEETDYTYQPTWMTWVSGSHGRPMKSLQMPRGHTSGQLCYVEFENVWMKLAITPNGLRSTQLSSIHSPHIWREWPCSHDWHMRTET